MKNTGVRDQESLIMSVCKASYGERRGGPIAEDQTVESIAMKSLLIRTIAYRASKKMAWAS